MRRVRFVCGCWIHCRAPAASPSAPPSLRIAAAPTAAARAAAAPPPPPGRFPVDRFTRPAHLDASLFESFAACAKGVPAQRDFKYWGGATNPVTGADEPWRNGTTDAAITDEGIIREEETFKAAVEQEDAGLSEEEAADKLHACGIRVDFVVALTYFLDWWDWETWEVREINEAS